MKRVCFILSLFFLIALMMPVLSQATTYDLGVVFPGDLTPAGTGPWLQASFTDVAGGVQLTLKATGLTSPNFVDASGQGELGWLFNINPAYDSQLGSLSIVLQAGSSNTAPVIATPTADGYGADGDGLYDFGFSFPSGDRFLPGYTDIFLISGITGLAASDFDFTSTHQGGEGEYITAAHIQGLVLPDGSTTSTWVANGVGNGGGGEVPEPATMILLGSGLIGLAGFARRKFRK